jgi:beta-lactamase family protein
LEPSDDIRSTFQYSNLGYLVAGMVAERISGQSWTEFTRARLTDNPRHSWVLLKRSTLIRGTRSSYRGSEAR